MSSDTSIYLAFDNAPGLEEEKSPMDDMSRAQRWLRRLVIAYNVFFWVTGPGIVGLGIWFYIALSEYEPIVVRQDVAGPAYIIIVGGATSIIAGIVGCLGGVNEHRRLLLTYFALMFIVCSLETSATVYTFTQYDDADSTVKSSFYSALGDYYCGDTSDVVDHVQRKFSCCGVESSFDWLTMNGTNSSTNSSRPADNVISREALPASCHEGGEYVDEVNAARVIFSQGCLSDIVDWLRRLYKISGWSLFAMACTQLLALGVICCLAKAVTFVYF